MLALGAPARADLFSPGDLAEKHAHLEGLSRCTACHPAGDKLSAQKCLDCHTELAGQVARRAGYHGRLPDEQRNACESCHHDHLGRAQPMTEWGPGGVQGFPHARAGWPLLGKHADVVCTGCHQSRLLALPEVRAWVGKHPSCRTWLGAPRSCEGCHFDEHRGPLKGSCADCHDAKAWSPAPGFRHDRTRYRLKGKHAKVKCTGCHPAVEDDETPAATFPAPLGRRYLKMSPLPFDRCARCHQDDDVHQNQYGPRCESCHLETSWTALLPDSIDRRSHAKFRYPLEGAHFSVECRACHGPFPGQKARFKPLPFEKCTDCHLDAHQRQLPRGADCAECHGLESFSPSKFELAAHAKTRFELEGAHRAVSCTGCHREEPALAARIEPSARQRLAREGRTELFSLARLDFPGKLDRCESCHADVHAGQFNERTCDSCHGRDSFAALTFDHSRDSRFPLAAAHEKAACASCHPVRERRGLQAVRYRGVERECRGCHRDVHVGQFDPAPDCARCHDERDWKRSTFEHRPPFTEALLDGAHLKVKCEKCHPLVPVAKGEQARRYRPLPTECAGCHADFHQGELEGFTP